MFKSILNSKFKSMFKKKEKNYERKKILVVCSSPVKRNNSDFRDRKNKLLKLNLFGVDPNYVFCDEKWNKCNFPDNVSENNFDVIWFAGCNLSDWIIKDNNTIIKIIQILKPNGIIVFTENENHKRRFGGDSENNLTVPFDIILQQSKNISPNREIVHNKLLDLFNRQFKMIIDKNNYTFYTIKELISCNNDDECKQINVTGTCEDDNYCYFDTIGGYRKIKSRKIKSRKNKSKKNKSRKIKK
jgi:hypothetical protein